MPLAGKIVSARWFCRILMAKWLIAQAFDSRHEVPPNKKCEENDEKSHRYVCRVISENKQYEAEAHRFLSQ